MEKLGEKIRTRRQSLKLTAKDLAKKIGVDPTYITYIEKHGKFPSPAVMKKIENALEDPMLGSIYLKTKYPEVCKEFEEGQKDVAVVARLRIGAVLPGEWLPSSVRLASTGAEDTLIS